MTAFPYDLNNLLGGAVRVVYAPTAEAVPDDPVDLFDQVSPYAVNGTWLDFGGTKESFNYDRSFDVEGWEIQQESGAVIEEVTSISRSVTVSLAELTPEAFKIIEEAPAIETISAISGQSEYKKLPFGDFKELTRYRIGFVSRRSKVSGIVTEPGGATRGRFVLGVGLLSQVSADSVQLEQAKGELAAVPVTFTFFPDNAQSEGEEYGAWYFEEAGTIT